MELILGRKEDILVNVEPWRPATDTDLCPPLQTVPATPLWSLPVHTLLRLLLKSAVSKPVISDTETFSTISNENPEEGTKAACETEMSVIHSVALTNDG